MLELGLKILIGYLLGSLMGALLIGAARGVDIREQGSGNAGGTNALRTQGFWFAAGVVVIDVGKGCAGGRLAAGVGHPGHRARCRRRSRLARRGLRGGGGRRPRLAAVPRVPRRQGRRDARRRIARARAGWSCRSRSRAGSLIVLLTGFVGLATMVAAATVPVAVWFLGPPSSPLFAFAVAMAAFLVWTHRSNIGRMRRGNEPRMTGLWLLRPRTPGS